MKLRPKILQGYQPDIENRVDTSDYPSNHSSGIKTGFNGKLLEYLIMKLVGSRLLNFLV